MAPRIYPSLGKQFSPPPGEGKKAKVKAGLFM